MKRTLALLLTVFCMACHSKKEDIAPVSKPSLTITYPKGGESYAAGQQISIAYEGTGIPTGTALSVGISSTTFIAGTEVIQHQTVIPPLASSIALYGTHQVAVTLPYSTSGLYNKSIPIGGRTYRIQISVDENESSRVLAESSFFTIVGPPPSELLRTN